MVQIVPFSRRKVHVSPTIGDDKMGAEDKATVKK